MRAKARELRTAMTTALAATKKVLERSARTAAKAKTYQKDIRDRLEKQHRINQNRVRKMADQLQYFPRKVRVCV